MGSLLRWLKSSFTKVKHLQEFNREWRDAFIYPLYLLSSQLEIWVLDIKIWDFSSAFSCFLHFDSNCSSGGTLTVVHLLSEVKQIGEFMLWKGPTSLLLKGRLWYWWAEVFIKLSILMCCITFREVCIMSMNADTVCVKSKKSIYMSKLVLLFQSSGQ